MGARTGGGVLVAIVLCLNAACSAATAGDTSGMGNAFREMERGWVEVLNDGHSDVTVYMLRDGMRYRLGRVARMEAARFRVPDALRDGSNRVALVAQAPGAQGMLVTPTLLMQPGQSITARLGRAFTRQSFDVWLRR